MLTKSAGIFNNRNETQVSPCINDVKNYKEYKEFSEIILEGDQNYLNNFHARIE